MMGSNWLAPLHAWACSWTKCFHNNWCVSCLAVQVRSFKLGMMITAIEVNMFKPLLVALTHFQCHSGVASKSMKVVFSRSECKLAELLLLFLLWCCYRISWYPYLSFCSSFAFLFQKKKCCTILFFMWDSGDLQVWISFYVRELWIWLIKLPAPFRFSFLFVCYVLCVMFTTTGMQSQVYSMCVLS